LRSLWNLLHNSPGETLETDAQWITRLVNLGQQLNLHLRLDEAQELYYQQLPYESEALRQLGKALAIETAR
jgi:hypothetical protein